MNWQYTSLVVVFSLAAGLSLWMALYAWRRRAAPGGIFFAWLMVAIAIWDLTSAAEFAAIPVSTKILWSQISYLGIVNVAPLWFLFALYYSEPTPWLAGRKIALLWIIPITILILVGTNEWHRWIWPSVTPSSEARGAMLIYEHGPAGWVNAVYSYLLLLLGTFYLIRGVLYLPTVYRKQGAALFISAAIPWIGNLVYLAGLSPLPGLDLTPLAFVITGLLMVWGLFRLQILNLVPIARDALIENMTDAVLVVDTNHRIVDANPAVGQLAGHDRSHLVGQPVEILQQRWPKLMECCLGPAEVQVEIGLENLSPPQWFELRASPLYDRRQRLNGWLLVFHDITERKQAEETLRQYAAELEARNADRDAFVHTVAHDLKGPLSVIIGFSSLLETQWTAMSSEEIEETLKWITQTGHKAVNIITELLILASVRRAEEIEAHPFDMGTVVAEAQRRLHPMIIERKAEILMPDVWPTVFGYGPWVEEVWVNYLSNALKYGGTPPRIELGFEELMDEADEASTLTPIRFWVKDHGPGLAPEEQERLFIPFTQLKRTHIEGHGLGLSIVRYIVERLGGQVGVDSQVGQGSTFWFTLRGLHL